MTVRLEDRQARELPVYLFTGFLGGGKTTFIQDTLNSPDFDPEVPTLLLVCEEGEAEYDISAFASPENVFVEYIDDEADLTRMALQKLESKYRFDRILVEYNGMWMLQSLFASLPPNWIVAQEMLFVDATTFLMYNQNMRQLCFDKMQTAELVVFNRCTKGFDKMPFHKEVRVANRRSQILYEYGPYDVEPDDIEGRCRSIRPSPKSPFPMMITRSGTGISTRTRTITRAKP